ncbi:helix-turn-helix transcriptional regulator [Vaginisenegalia massiliensis]|uniref:helix-turn-helix transcriptional regulator n=1 Tax=Vaginisenegalia massiliensis TaxID=2058294 RepID=UPI000F521072|nr:helix-turn-helix transcriptional regulator [Vaginisenegalia massiliensis]
MESKIILRNNLKEVRKELHLSQATLAELVGVSRNTISSIETGQYTPTAKLACLICMALNKKFEELFYIMLVSDSVDEKG